MTINLRPGYLGSGYLGLGRFAAIAIAVALLLTGCSGADSDPKSNAADLAQRLASAQRQLADAPASQITLKATNVPDGTVALAAASGRGYQGDTPEQAAFIGKVSVVTGGTTINARVIAAEGKVWAKTGFSQRYLSMRPEQLGAANPADLFGVKGQGVSTLLTKTNKLTADGSSRDGRTVLTTIKGQLPGRTIARYLPIADEQAPFDVSYRLTDDDILQDATISGPFYAKGEEVSYELRIVGSQDDSAIEPPRQGGGK